MDKNKVIAYAQNLEQSALKAQDWIKNNEKLVESKGKNCESVLKELRRYTREFRMLKKAAGRKMCVGVFGPSQAGKSYLLSSLARDSENRLICDFLGNHYNFITDIDPGGGRESTGLVTRFTMTRPEGIPEGYPVHIRLLSETELVKIFANTFFCDAVQKNIPDKGKIQTDLATLKARVGAKVAHLDIDEMEDLREYVTKSFGNKSRAAALDEVYWNDAVKIAPYLSLRDRAALYSIIWDNIEEFTDLLKSLLDELEKLRFADEAFCRIQALIPREASIIDVETLGKKDFSDSKAENTVEVKTREGVVASIPRCYLTAIVAELTLVMVHKPADYFDHTDLLDFPGYKARLECTNIREYLHSGKKDSAPEQFFRRGKVAYLFQRYNAERELTSLLLCVSEPTNVPGLPAAVEDWIIATHGPQPGNRQNMKTALLYILTKSDRYFEEKAGLDSSAWANVLKGVFLNHFGGSFSYSTKWVDQWTPQVPFKNLFLLRNINVKWGMMYEFDQNNRELSIRSDKIEFKEKMRKWFLETPSVSTHFQDPEAAFDALLAPNDGGMERIKNTLAPLCNPDLKLSQIDNQLREKSTDLCEKLEIYWISGDKDEELKKKTAMFGQVAKLFINPKFKERFPELLSRLTVSSDNLFYLHEDAVHRCEEYKEQAFSSPEEPKEEEYPSMDTTASDDSPLIDIEGLFDTSPQSDSNPNSENAGFKKQQEKDEHYFYAESIIKTWSEQLHALAKLASVRSYYAFPQQPDLFTCMLDEMDTAIARMKLQSELEKKFRELSRFSDVKIDTIIRKQANYAVGKLNEFVCWLGSASERTINYNQKKVTIFAPRPEVQGYPELSEDFQPFNNKWYQEWLFAFYGMIVDNVNYFEGTEINLEQNVLIGTILRQIKEANDA